jgi:hypothetical protein
VSIADSIAAFCKVVGSTLSPATKATLFNVTGIAAFRFDETSGVVDEDPSDDKSEQAHAQEAFQSLGIIGRPLPPSGDLFAEALALRTQDGLVPHAFRDLRLHQALNAGAGGAPAEGQLVFCGYGGAFLSHAMTASNTGSKKGNVTTLYVPHEFDGSGVPTKAHAIAIDPTPGNSSIALTHASGLFLALTEDTGSGPGIVASVDGATFLRMSAGELTINAEKITLKGNCYLGAQAEAGLPLLAGPLSPPGPSVFISPV